MRDVIDDELVLPRERKKADENQMVVSSYEFASTGAEQAACQGEGLTIRSSSEEAFLLLPDTFPLPFRVVDEP